MRSRDPGCCAKLSLSLLVGLSLVPLAPGRVQAADPKEAAQQIAQLQTAGRQAYKDHNYQAAADRYRELIQRFPDAAEVPAARLNVARMLLEGPQKNPDAAIEALKPILDQQEFPQRAELLYEAGLAHRELGERLFTKAQHDSAADAPKTRAAAKEQFELAATHFSGAANAFASRGGPIKVSETESISVDFEWALRAKCDQAEMLNRAEDFSATLAAIERFLDHPLLAKSHYQHLALYQHGQAAFALKDYPTACRDLGKLAPFADRGIGLHTQYLLARMHQEMDELPEAARHYEAILTGYEAEKKMAQDALRDGNAFRDNPDERLRLEAIQRDPPPEFVRRCELQLGEIALADHRYADAAGRFQNFLKTNPPGELLAQTQLQLAMAQTGAKQFADALRLLQPLRDREPLAEAARTWSARAFVGGADPTKGPAYDQELNKAAEDFRHAIELAGKAKDPAAAARRIGLQCELAEVALDLKHPADAVALYQQILADPASAPRREELLARSVLALQLAGKYPESEASCREFEQQYPQSEWLADVAFRSAENVLQLARAAAKQAPVGAEAKRLFAEVIARGTKLLERFPESPNVNLSRLAIATAHYQLGQYAEAAEALTMLPDADRQGELAAATYLQADSLLRTLPTDASDAISAGRLMSQLDEAIKLLTKYVALPPATPNMPEAYLQLIHAQLEYASLLADPKERNDSLNGTRALCEKFKQFFNNHPLKPQMYMERSRCVAMLGDLNTAVNDLNRFQSDPYRQSSIAPLALLRMATYMRQQNRVPDALRVIEQCRSTYEPALLADPARKDWVPQLQLQNAELLREAKKLPEARTLFEAVAEKFPKTPAGIEAVWRAAQCRRDESVVPFEAVKKSFAPGSAAKPEERAAAQQTAAKLLQDLRQAAARCEQTAGEIAGQPALLDLRLQLCYEAAWSHRAGAELQWFEERETRQHAQLAHDRAALDGRIPMGQAKPDLQAVEIPLVQLAVAEEERQAAKCYRELIEAGPEAQLALDARLELAEMFAARNNYDSAAKLVAEALEKDPTPAMVDRLLLMQGQCLLMQKDYTAALDKFEPIAKNEKNPLSPEARFRIAEIFYQQGEWQKAVDRLTPFRDRGELQNLADTSERAFFRLGQAYMHLQQWEPARQAFENFVNRFGNSADANEARFMIGLARSNMKQYDDAVNWLQQVVHRTATERGAEANLLIGRCRLEQKRFPESLTALTAAATWYDFREPAAEALLETARLHVEQKQPDSAKKALQQVLDRFPDSPWSENAKKRLAELK